MEEKKLYIKDNRYASFSNVDRHGKLKPIEAARWFQDLFLKQDKILGDEELTQYGWILLNYDMNIYKYPVYEGEYQVETYPYSFNRFYGNRIFLMKDMEGKVLIEAKTRWLYVDRSNLKIKKITPEIAKHYYIDEIAKGKGFEVDKFDDVDFSDVTSQKLTLRYNDLDLNNHVNNTMYFALFYDFIDKETLEKYEPYKIQITYKKQITINDEVDVYVKDTIEDNQKYSYVKMCCGEEDHTYIKVLWQKKDEH